MRDSENQVDTVEVNVYRRQTQLAGAARSHGRPPPPGMNLSHGGIPLEAHARPLPEVGTPARERSHRFVPRVPRKPAAEQAAPPAIREALTGLADVERRDRVYRRALAFADVISFAVALL